MDEIRNENLEIGNNVCKNGFCLDQQRSNLRDTGTPRDIIEAIRRETNGEVLQVHCSQVGDFGILFERKEDRFRVEPNQQYRLPRHIIIDLLL